MSTNKLGRAGETWATLYLWLLGVTILKRNWRTKYFEVDIIGFQNKTLLFIEVKTRLLSPNKRHYDLIERFSEHQNIHLIKAATAFKNRDYKYTNYSIRIDFIEVVLIPLRLPKIKWIKGINKEQ